MTASPASARPGATIDPVPDGVSPHAIYEALLARDELAFQSCAACSRAVFPPRQRCAHCGADALRWHRSAGEGTVYSATVITPRGADPYAVVLVDLDEGHRMMSRIDVDATEVRIGDRVVVHFQHGEDRVLPLFTPVAHDEEVPA